MFSKSYIKQEKTYVDDGQSTMIDCLRTYAERLGETEAFVFASHTGNREGVAWVELLDKSIAVAKSLIQLGVKPGEFVAINVRCCPEWLYIAFGTMIAGACVASISFTYKDGSDLVSTMEKLAKCSLLVMDPGEDGENWNIVKSLLDKYSTDGMASSQTMPFLRYVIGHEKGNEPIMDGVRTLVDLIYAKHPDISLPAVTVDDLGVLLQTSGSTGVPKLVALSQRNLTFTLQTSSGVDGFLNPNNILFNDRPFSWYGGFPWSVLTGQKRVTINGFEPAPKDKVASVVDIIVREKCNMIVVLPPMLHALVERKDQIPKDWPVQSVLTGGQPLSKGVSKAIGSLSTSIVSGYGGTEFSIPAAGTSNQFSFKEFWCGTLLEGPALEVKIVDENDEIVPVNTKGELFVKSDGVFQCYYNDPTKTAAVKTPDGWYKTDDICLMTEDGEFYIYGRKSNLIISGGMNVAPEILEHSLKQCPGIATVLVVPVPDVVYYQVLCACLIREEGSDVTEQQVRAFCKDIHNDEPGLFTVLPKYYVFLDSFPETATGKTSRPALTKWAESIFGSSQK